MSKFDPKAPPVAMGTTDDDDIEILEIVGLDESPNAPFSDERETDAEEAHDIVLDFEDADEAAVAAAGSALAGDADQADDERARRVRLQADFENFKKRVEREREADQRQASARLVDRLLPVLDNFERAISAGVEGQEGDNFHQGVQLIFRQFLDELRREGLEAVDTVGESFDPNHHEAVATEESLDWPHNTVLEELQRGYTLHGRLLRPALVRVSVRPGQETIEGQSDEGEQHG